MQTQAGIHVDIHRYDEDVSQATLEQEVVRICANQMIDGVLIQLPLAPHLDEEAVMEKLDPKKDVDGFHPLNMGWVLISCSNGRRFSLDCFNAGNVLMRALEQRRLLCAGVVYDACRSKMQTCITFANCISHLCSTSQPSRCAACAGLQAHADARPLRAAGAMHTTWHHGAPAALQCQHPRQVSCGGGRQVCGYLICDGCFLCAHADDAGRAPYHMGDAVAGQPD